LSDKTRSHAEVKVVRVSDPSISILNEAMPFQADIVEVCEQEGEKWDGTEAVPPSK
jgi:hypothetical protein